MITRLSAALVRSAPATRLWLPPARALSSAAGASTANTGAVVEIASAAEFESLVMAASSAAPPVGGPVLLDLYADWCQPCKMLTPKLEALVTSSRGAVRLAKLNVDNVPEIAQALQVKSLPTVMMVHKGKLVDQFQGVLPDDKLKAFVQKAIDLAGGGGQGPQALEAAALLLDEGDVAGATEAYVGLLALPELAASAKAGLALCALKDDNMAVAQDMVAELHKAHPGDLDKADVRKAVSAVRLAADTSGDGESRSVDELRASLEVDPAAHATRFELAQALLRQQDAEGAVAELLVILKRDKAFAVAGPEGNKTARELVLQVFDSLGNDHDVTKKGRRRLANILLM